MTTILTRRSFSFFEIDEGCKKNFVPQQWCDLSEFHANALKWVGDAMRQTESQYFWSGGAYCWYTDAAQSHEQRVWQTANGTLMFEDCTENKLYRVQYK